MLDPLGHAREFQNEPVDELGFAKINSKSKKKGNLTSESHVEGTDGEPRPRSINDSFIEGVLMEDKPVNQTHAATLTNTKMAIGMIQKNYAHPRGRKNKFLRKSRSNEVNRKLDNRIEDLEVERERVVDEEAVREELTKKLKHLYGKNYRDAKAEKTALRVLPTDQDLLRATVEEISLERNDIKKSGKKKANKSDSFMTGSKMPELPSGGNSFNGVVPVLPNIV